MKVLIVEDDPLIAEDLRGRFAELGCDVLPASATLGPARTALSNGDVDLAIVDVDLADGDSGLDLLDRETLNGSRAYVVTGRAEAVPGDLAGSFPVLSKPLAENAVEGLVELIRHGRVLA